MQHRRMRQYPTLRRSAAPLSGSQHAGAGDWTPGRAQRRPWGRRQVCTGTTPCPFGIIPYLSFLPWSSSRVFASHNVGTRLAWGQHSERTPMRPYGESLVRRSNESRGYGRRMQVPAGLTLALTLLLSPTVARADDDGSLNDASDDLPRCFCGRSRILDSHAAYRPLLTGRPRRRRIKRWRLRRRRHRRRARARVGLRSRTGCMGVRGRAGYELQWSGAPTPLRLPRPRAPFTSPPPTPMQIGSAGVRYSIPFLVPLPFFEAMWGPSFNAGSVSIAGGLGVGPPSLSAGTCASMPRCATGSRRSTLRSTSSSRSSWVLP